jgi:hypothetical protein
VIRINRCIAVAATIAVAALTTATANAQLQLTGNTAYTADHSIYANGEINVRDASSLHVVAGGIVGSAYGYNSGTVTVSGGRVGTAWGYNASATNVSGGVAVTTFGLDDSTFHITGGTVGDAFGFGASTTNIGGGDVSGIYGYENSTFNITGGAVWNVRGYENSVINIRGGILSSLRLYGDSAVNLFGTGLSFSSALVYDNMGNPSTLYALSGALQDGQSVDGIGILNFGNYHSAGGGGNALTFRALSSPSAAAPEPGTIALLLPILGVAIARRKRAVR